MEGLDRDGSGTLIWNNKKMEWKQWEKCDNSEKFSQAQYWVLKTESEGTGTALVVQWLRLRASVAGGMGSIANQETNIPHAQGIANK